MGCVVIMEMIYQKIVIGCNFLSWYITLAEIIRKVDVIFFKLEIDV